MAGSGVALARANAALAQFSNQELFVVNGARPGLDAYGAIMAAVNKCKAAGGGRVLLPYIGGYTVSAPIVIAFDNCTILLDDDVTFTMTDPTKLVGPNAPYATGFNGAGIVGFLFGGRLAGPGQKNYIKRPQLIGLRKVTVDTQAQNVTGFTYNLGYTGQHAPVVFLGCDDALCENIVFKNGLVGGLIAFYGSRYLIRNCTADKTLYDNGITVGFNREHLAYLSDTDPTTWSNSRIIDCTAMNCANHGIGSYGAIGVTNINPVVFNCGNNTPASSYQPAGGINVEYDGTNAAFDYRATVVNPRVDGSYGFGFRTNCKGTRIIGGRISGTKNPSAYTDSTPKIWGSGVFVQGAGTLEMIGTDVENSEQFGIRVAGAGSNFPSLFIRGGRFTGNGFNPAGTTGAYALSAALYAVDFNEITISSDTLWENNGNTVDATAGSQYTINLYNGVTNVDGGKAVIAGRFDNNYGGVWSADRVGNIDATQGISGFGNGAAWASNYYQMFVPNKVTWLQLAKVNLLSGGNGKTARICNIIFAVNVAIDYTTILGDQTNSGIPKVQLPTISGTSYNNYPQGAIFVSYAATYTPNSSNGDIIFGGSHITGNMTIANDAPSFTPSFNQTITFTLQQDATGGRVIAWGAGWKGATLTGAGTANQIAQVTFRWTGSTWLQIANTGWIS